MLTAGLNFLFKAVPAVNGVRAMGAAAFLALAAALGAFFVVPHLLHRSPAQVAAKQDARAAAASAAIGADAVARLAAHADTAAQIDHRTEEAAHDVQSTPGADASAPAVARALHDALCLSDAYRAQPDCAAVRGDPARVGAAAPDPGRGAAR